MFKQNGIMNEKTRKYNSEILRQNKCQMQWP